MNKHINILLVALLSLQLYVVDAEITMTVVGGSNEWWIGLNVAGDDSIVSVAVSSANSNNFTGASRQAYGAWTVQSSNPLVLPISVRLVTNAGEVYEAEVDSFSTGYVINPRPAAPPTYPGASGPLPTGFQATRAQCAADSCIPKAPSNLQAANQYTPSDWVINLYDETKYVKLPGGNVSYMNITSFPVLQGKNLAVSIAFLAPCGLILPHLHPRADKTIIMTEGKEMYVGFIVENRGQATISKITVGMATIIPKAAIHYVENPTCEKTTQLDFYNHEDPGLLTLGLNIFRFPNTATGTAFGLDEEQTQQVKDSIPSYPLFQNKECLQRCGLSPNPPS